MHSLLNPERSHHSLIKTTENTLGVPKQQHFMWEICHKGDRRVKKPNRDKKATQNWAKKGNCYLGAGEIKERAHHQSQWVNLSDESWSHNWLVCRELEPWETCSCCQRGCRSKQRESSSNFSVPPAGHSPTSNPIGKIQHKSADKGVFRNGSPLAFGAEQKSEEWLWEQIAQ